MQHFAVPQFRAKRSQAEASWVAHGLTHTGHFEMFLKSETDIFHHMADSYRPRTAFIYPVCRHVGLMVCRHVGLMLLSLLEEK
jgi:hypothetical protein